MIMTNIVKVLVLLQEVFIEGSTTTAAYFSLSSASNYQALQIINRFKLSSALVCSYSFQI